jgi:plastocyanin
MARRNLVRSWLAVSLLALTGAAAVLVAPAPPAGAVDNNYVDVLLTATGFIPATVYARPGDLVRFSLDTSDPNMTRNHTVTLEAGRCASLPNQLCEKNFDDPSAPPVFRFSTADTYPYFDRIARDAGNNVRGTIIVTNQPPVTTSTNPPPVDETSTTTTAPVRETTTTTDGSVHTFVINGADPVATTTTTTPPHLTVINTGPPAGKPATGAGGAAAAADAGKAKGKPATTTTTAPPPVPASVLDPAALIPAPDAVPAPTADAPTNVDDVTSAAADLLHNDHGADDGTRLLLIAVAALGVFLLGGGLFGWYHRSSRYFPA